MTKLQQAIQLCLQDYANDQCVPVQHVLHETGHTDPYQYEYWEEDIQWFKDSGFEPPETIELNVQVHCDLEAPDIGSEPQYSVLCGMVQGKRTYYVIRLEWGVETVATLLHTVL